MPYIVCYRLMQCVAFLSDARSTKHCKNEFRYYIVVIAVDTMYVFI